jgi:hypothetical protein
MSDQERCDEVVEVDLELLFNGIDSLNDYVEEVIVGNKNCCLEDISYQVVGGKSNGNEYIGGTVSLRVQANIVPIILWGE